MDNNNIYQLNCPHCGEFITLSVPPHNNLKNEDSIVWSDKNLGNITISNSYKNSGSFGTYEAMDVEMICPHCYYNFKSTVHANYTL
ncbi:Uncharacterised protein [uncultured Clostridium sp.]|nr:Uncharacterised protein [uncultured Clostridium sp.]